MRKKSLQKTLREQYNIDEHILVEGQFVSLLPKRNVPKGRIVMLAIGLRHLVVAGMKTVKKKTKYEILMLIPLTLVSLGYSEHSILRRVKVTSEFQQPHVYQLYTCEIPCKNWADFKYIINQVKANNKPDHGANNESILNCKPDDKTSAATTQTGNGEIKFTQSSFKPEEPGETKPEFYIKTLTPNLEPGAITFTERPSFSDSITIAVATSMQTEHGDENCLSDLSLLSELEESVKNRYLAKDQTDQSQAESSSTCTQVVEIKRSWTAVEKNAVISKTLCNPSLQPNVRELITKHFNMPT